MEKGVFTFVKALYALVFSLIMASVFFCSGMDYLCKNTFLLHNVVILTIIAVTFLCVAGIYFICNKKRSRFNNENSLIIEYIMPVMSVALFFWQSYFCYNIFFTTDWDVEVVLAMAQNIAINGEASHLSSYFSLYPNNMVICFVYALLLKVNNVLGFFEGEYAMMCIVVVNCLINSVSCFLVYKTANIFVNKKTAFATFCIAILSIGLSAWSVICYSDALALFIPILCVFLYCKPQKNKYTKIACVISAIIISVIGYYIKPQCAIVAIAILIIEIARLISGFSLKKLIKPTLLLLVALLTMCFTNLSLDMIMKKNDIILDENKAFGMSHFLMMGLNEERQGVYSGDDVHFSGSFATSEERTEANLDEALNRIRNMKGDIVKHLQKKMMITFNDGTFAWEKEGVFYVGFPEETNSKAAPFFKDVYYSSGQYYKYLALMQHSVWIGILFFSFLSVFTAKTMDKKWELTVLWVIILGFVLYEMLFEVRARYLYIFVPIMCVLAAIGLKNTFKLSLDMMSETRSLIERKKEV